MNENQPEVLLNCQCLLGESPVWDAGRQRVIWLDILSKEIYLYPLQTGDFQVINIEKTPGCIALTADGESFVAVEDGFGRIDLASGHIEMLARLEEDEPDNRFNDGKFDPAGRFWAGSMSVSGKPAAGNLYAMDTDGSVKLKIAGVSCSNGMAWNSDHSKFYYIDTPTGRVASFSYDLETGNISDEGTVTHIDPKDGLPDGMTIDIEDKLWLALWDGGKVVRIDPETGRVVRSVSLPVSRVTSCTFGGKNMQDLFITSARAGLTADQLEKQPLAGSLFVIRDVLK